MITEDVHHIHLVSDSTGETINGIARACLAQFNGVKVKEHFWSLIRTMRQLDMVFEGLRQWPGLVFYTFVDNELKEALVRFCESNNIKSIAVMDPVLDVMAEEFGVSLLHKPGKQHRLNKEYFTRIEAMNFALALDDGNHTEKVIDADVLLLGVSRTSKTPTCIYLANRGIKAANIPIIPEVPLPIDINELNGPFIVGLTKDPSALVETRKNRLKVTNGEEDISYIDLDKVEQEVLFAKRLFARLGCPVIDVTRRSVEEISAEIIMLISKRELEEEIEKQAEKSDV